MSIFLKNGYLCLLSKDDGESYENYYKRLVFVVSQKPKDIEEYNESVKYSRIYINKKYFGCEYSSIIMKKTDEMEKNMYVE